MEIDRLVWRTAVGGVIVAGGVVLAQTAASADEATATTSGAPAPLKKRVAQATAPASKAATTARPAKAAPAAPAAKAGSTPKAGSATGTRKAAKPPVIKPAAKTKATTAVAIPKPAVASPDVIVAAAPAPSVALSQSESPNSALATAAPATEAPSLLGGAAKPAVVVDAPTTRPLSGPTRTSDDGLVADESLVAAPTALESTTPPEISSGEPVASGPPPVDDAVAAGSAPANDAAVSTSPSARTAALTGTSPNGQLSITINQPSPGTVVRPGTPVTVTGSVTGGGGGSSVNVIYVIDVSGSTSGSGGACGDSNGDSSSDTILDCEIAGLTALNTSLGSSPIDVSLVTFDSSATTEDLSTAPGDQLTTRPTTDVGGNGTPDVVDVLRTLRFGGGTNFDAALTAVRPLIVAGEQNFVFFLSDGESSLSTGPGSPLQAVADAGARVLTFAVGTGTAGCASGESLRDIADATGGTCTEVTDPARLSSALTGTSVAGAINRIEIQVNGFVGNATLNPLGGFSIVVPAGVLQPGRNDILARAIGAGAQAGQTATADTFVIVGVSPVGAAGLDFDGFLFDDDDFDEDFDEDFEVHRVKVASFDDADGILPVTGTGAAHLVATGSLSFLLGGLFLGGARHLRRRRRAPASA